MSTKKELLQVLESDMKKIKNMVPSIYPKKPLMYKKEEYYSVKEYMCRVIQDTIEKAGINLGFIELQRWSIERHYENNPSDLPQDVYIGYMEWNEVDMKRDKAIAKINEDFENIKRCILLHGASKEVVEMIQGFSKSTNNTEVV